MTEPIYLDTNTDSVERQFPVPLQLKESKVRLSSGDFDQKRSESFQDMVSRKNTWLAQVRTRSQLASTHACVVGIFFFFYSSH